MPEKAFILLRAMRQRRKLDAMIRTLEARGGLEPNESSYYDSLLSGLELTLEPLGEELAGSVR